MAGVLQVSQDLDQFFNVSDVKPAARVSQGGRADFNYNSHVCSSVSKPVNMYGITILCAGDLYKK